MKLEIVQLEHQANLLHNSASKLPWQPFKPGTVNTNQKCFKLLEYISKLKKLDHNINHHYDKKKNSGRRKQRALLYHRIVNDLTNLEQEVTWKLLEN